MRRWDYEYYRFYVAWKGCFARLAEVFTYRAYSYLCVEVTYKYLLGFSTILKLHIKLEKMNGKKLPLIHF